MAIISNAVTMTDAGAFSVGLGAQVLIKTLTASSSGTLNFVNGASGVVLNSTYPIYKFEFIDIHAATSGAHFTVNFRDGGTAYDATKTTTTFNTYHDEAGNNDPVSYSTGGDLAQGTGTQDMAPDLGIDNDQSTCGELLLFNPASTTFVKHFLATVNGMTDGSPPYTEVRYSAGYFNTTTALTRVQFKMDSGNIDVGDICLYGIS